MIKSAFIHLLLVLLLSGPTTPNKSLYFSSNYPYGICLKNVKDSHCDLLCDKCELWFHIDCLEFPVSNYSTLLNDACFSWVCTNCVYSNYSQGAPNLTKFFACTTSYSILTICSDDDKDLPNTLFFYQRQPKIKLT